MSSGLSVRAALEAYVAGRAPAQGVVPVVAAAFYRKGEAGTRDALRPVMAVIERAAPGVVELARTDGAPGFAVAAAERAFPAAYEAELRHAAESALAVLPVGSAPPQGDGSPGLLGRLWSAVQRLFTRSG
jgi:hypothetical protein